MGMWKGKALQLPHNRHLSHQEPIVKFSGRKFSPTISTVYLHSLDSLIIDLLIPW